MERIVLLAVAAAWAAVLVPPLIRNRSDSRPSSSVSDFSRQLSSLQRSVPTRGMGPMRSMARPLAQSPSPFGRPLAGRAGQTRRVLTVVPALPRESSHGSSPHRRSHGEPLVVRNTSAQHPHRQTHLHRPAGRREEIRRRRTNVVLLLTMAFCSSLFLAATTKSNIMMYALALSFLSLCAYCYRLVQIRQVEGHTARQDAAWFRAA